MTTAFLRFVLVHLAALFGRRAFIAAGIGVGEERGGKVGKYATTDSALPATHRLVDISMDLYQIIEPGCRRRHAHVDHAILSWLVCYIQTS